MNEERGFSLTEDFENNRVNPNKDGKYFYCVVALNTALPFYVLLYTGIAHCTLYFKYFKHF